MKKDIIEFFAIGQKIFGTCSARTDDAHFFRLSDCKIYRRVRPPKDWFELLDEKEDQINRYDEKTEETRESRREHATELGRKIANRKIRKLDPVFSRNDLNPDDAKVIFQPIDYIVFNGMKKGDSSMRNIILLDRKAKEPKHDRIQKSIKATLDQKRYDWKTLRIDANNGKIDVE